MGSIGDIMANRLSNQEKKVLSFWGIGLIVFIVIILIINYFFPIKNLIYQLSNHEGNKNTKYRLVDDYTRYSTVSGAIEKFYSFINMKDYDSAIKILDEEYVKEKNVNKNNISSFIFINDKFLSYKPDKMYTRDTKGKVLYYVSGRVVSSNTSEEYVTEYLKVCLDGETFHFSITPISEETFKEVANG